MSILFRREFYGKAVSLLLALAFLAESTLAPILLSLPQTVSAQTASTITFSRAPATSPTAPYRVGSPTTVTAFFSPSLFAANQAVTVFYQIDAGAPYTAFTTSTFDIKNSGVCDVTTGNCSTSAAWAAESLACPAGITGTHQMTEWITTASGVTSNKIQWWFECAAGTIVIKATKDGAPWDSPQFTVNATGPTGSNDSPTDPPQTVPGVAAGTYTINSVTPPAGVTLQNINGNSLPYSQTLTAGGTLTVTFNFVSISPTAPALDSITPSIITNGDKNVTLILKGTNFRTGAQLRVFHPIGTLLDETTSTTTPAVSVISSSEMQWGPFPIISSNLGDYDIQVKNPDGQLSAQKRVTVTGTPLPPPPQPSGSAIRLLPPLKGVYMGAFNQDGVGRKLFEDMIGGVAPLWSGGFERTCQDFGAEGTVPKIDITCRVRLFADGYVSTYTIEPFAHHEEAGTPPVAVLAEKVTPQKIIDGAYDNELKEIARAIAGLGKPVLWLYGNEPFLQFGGYGPDGTWPRPLCDSFPLQCNRTSMFGDPTKADGPERFVAFAQHIHNVVEDEIKRIGKESPITWVMAALSSGEQLVPGFYKEYYPGNAYIDWHSFNWYPLEIGSKSINIYESISQNVGWKEAMALAPDKPVLIREFGVSSLQGDRSNWFKAFFNDMRTNPQMKKFAGFVYWQEDVRYQLGDPIRTRIPLTTSEAAVWKEEVSAHSDYWHNSVLMTVGAPPPLLSYPAPTPTTAPMATLTLNRDQEQVLPDQPISFSGTLKSDVLNTAGLAFPQWSSFFIAIPEKTVLERIEMDGRTLAPSEFSIGDGSIKIPFAQSWYAGSHSFRIVLRNAVSLVPQLDRQIAVWVTVVDAGSKLLLKGRTASTLVAHLPTEVIGKGVSLTAPRTTTGWMPNGISCCWTSVGLPLLESGGSAVPGSTYNIYDNKTYFPIREFGFSEIDITRGPFFTPNQIPLLPENIAFTLFPSDASMQRIGLSLKQFSDPLAKEFITAQYQYILGRDPSSEELSRYLPKFTQWRNPYANLMEVYNRRSDIQQAVMVPRDRHTGGSNDGSPRSSWDKLLEWAATKGWQEEPSLASFKPQTGFDGGWQLFKELWEKYAPLDGLGDPYLENYNDLFQGIANTNPVAAIAYLCYTSNLNHNGSQQQQIIINFEFCWKNDPLVRHAAILWAKDVGWAYNHIFKQEYADIEHGGYLMGVSDTIINPSGPILASMFGPGKYPEFAAEQQMRYPPAQLYYDLISSPEYASSIQQRFRTNIDSIYRLFFSRPATESDIAWVKNKFLGGIASYEFSDSKVFGFDRRWSWLNEQWEPNGGLIASNFVYVEDEEFLKNSRFITDDVYGIRHIPGEIDAVSSRLVEMIERTKRQELYQGDNFKRIITGLYRLYLRRNPTDAEIESRRASGKSFGDIEFSLNQSSEYGDGSAPAAAIRNLYRNYLGRDPSDTEIASWTGKSISTVANALGKSAEMKSYAQEHQENAYIFPIKEIKMKKCGFFCSILGKIVGIALNFVPGVGQALSAIYTIVSTGVSGGANITSAKHAGSLTHIVLNSISRGFNEAGFNGETFVSWVSIARAMAGQAGGAFSMTNIFENADPIILDGFRTMARAPQTPQGNAFAQAIQQTYPGLASPLGAVLELFGAGQTASVGRIAQIDVSSHYGSGAVAPSKGTSNAKGSTGTAGTTAKAQFTKTLKQGSRGTEVLKLQKLLGEMDLVFLSEYQTGYYGAKTVAAVKRFQKRNGLEQVGFVGAKTRSLLNSAR